MSDDGGFNRRETETESTIGRKKEYCDTCETITVHWIGGKDLECNECGTVRDKSCTR